MSIYWVTSNSTYTINGTNFNGHIVAESGTILNLNCSNINGDVWTRGTFNLLTDVTINGNVNIGSLPTVEWLMEKPVV
jgi:hypothetical protein